MKVHISETHQKILFHVGLWSIWLYLSLASARDEEFWDRAILITSLIVTTHIPLFLVNTEWLIPKILNRKGAVYYFWSLFAAFLAFSLIHYGLINVIDDFLLQMDGHKPGKSLKGIVAVIMEAAISTGYGLLNYVMGQEKRQQEQKQERLQSELSFLRSQISPHFIFNILNSIVYLIRSKSELAEPVTLKLSELMRYILYESDHAHISLEKEVSYLKNYVELQQVRFEEDVEVRFVTEGEAAGQMIEPMLLIPFVENAFKHGVGMVQHPVIDIRLQMTKSGLTLSVQNKITPDIAIQDGVGSGIGLKNVTRRLELLYPEKHQLTIKNEDGWFTVMLSLTLS